MNESKNIKPPKYINFNGVEIKAPKELVVMKKGLGLTKGGDSLSIYIDKRIESFDMSVDQIARMKENGDCPVVLYLRSSRRPALFSVPMEILKREHRSKRVSINFMSLTGNDQSRMPAFMGWVKGQTDVPEELKPSEYMHHIMESKDDRVVLEDLKRLFVVLTQGKILKDVSNRN